MTTEYLPLSNIALLFETRFLTKHTLFTVDESGWPVSPWAHLSMLELQGRRDWLLCAFTAWGLIH